MTLSEGLFSREGLPACGGEESTRQRGAALLLLRLLLLLLTLYSPHVLSHRPNDRSGSIIAHALAGTSETQPGARSSFWSCISPLMITGLPMRRLDKNPRGLRGSLPAGLARHCRRRRLGFAGRNLDVCELSCVQ